MFQILDDALHLAQNGLLPYDTALSQTLYLSAEDNFIPWSAALSAFSYVKLMLRRSAGYPDYTAYLTAAMEPRYDALGFYPQDATDALLDVLLRGKIVDNMCDIRYVRDREKKCQKWLVYCTGYVE